jgi:hypothetical protein
LELHITAFRGQRRFYQGIWQASIPECNAYALRTPARYLPLVLGIADRETLIVQRHIFVELLDRFGQRLLIYPLVAEYPFYLRHRALVRRESTQGYADCVGLVLIRSRDGSGGLLL